MNGAFIGLTVAAALVGSPTYARPEPGGQVVNAICLPVEAKPADVTPGKIVRDSYRLLLGSVKLVGSDSAVVTGEYGSLRFPLEAFGEWCDGSLVLKISPQRFKKMVTEQQSK
jgi:hypothetical protein